MRTFKSLFAIGAILLLPAAPVSAAACPRFSTFHALVCAWSSDLSGGCFLLTLVAQFDKLVPGHSPAPGFAFVNWTNFAVQPASTYQLTPHSAPNIVLADGFRSSLSFTPTGPNPEQAFAVLRAFSFACVVPYPEGSFLPVSCSLTVVREGTYPSQQVASFGPYSFFANYSMPSGTFPMANVSLANVETTPGAGGIEGTNLFFYVTKTGPSGPGGSGVSIAFDDMALAKYNKCPH